MQKRDKTITLIGKRLAEKDVEFVYRGPTEECEPCKLHKSCLNLEEGRRYRVISVRRSAEHDCLLHDGSVRAVEVELAPVLATLEAKKAIKGSTVIYRPVECDEDCENVDLCTPMGAVERRKYVITRVLQNSPIKCHRDLSLKPVELRTED